MSEIPWQSRRRRGSRNGWVRSTFASCGLCNSSLQRQTIPETLPSSSARSSQLSSVADRGFSTHSEVSTTPDSLRLAVAQQKSIMFGARETRSSLGAASLDQVDSVKDVTATNPFDRPAESKESRRTSASERVLSFFAGLFGTVEQGSEKAGKRQTVE